ncbi:MAG TPA: DNA-3-methyladenine glycosylase 2 family protein [Allosphingosinicella sp.]|nr:DNA-3-methyladenine glycosylase 2 family protein [Allosphingosinicella sp.]
MAGIPAEQLRSSLEELERRDPAIAAAIAVSGFPEPRFNDPGYVTLLRTIIGQQVSLASARAIWAKLEAALGDVQDPAVMAAASHEALRGAGLSRQKMSYARSLAEEIVTGRLNLETLAQEDEAAIAELVRIKGIGRWSAEIYLLFAEGRPDVWPAGDLAVQIAMGRILGLPDKPSERQLRELAQPWSPHRGALAIFAWHHYKTPVL